MIGKKSIPMAGALLFLSSFCFSADPEASAPPRLIDGESHVSMVIPENWSIDLDFPEQPLFYWTTPEKSTATIFYQPGRTLKQTHMRVELPVNALQEFARQDLAAQHPSARILAAEARIITGRNAFEVTWTEDMPDAIEAQSIYTFADDRFLCFTLKTEKNSFPWQVPDFQKWISTIQFLSRSDSGALPLPAHGGIWIQKTAGARVTLPAHWLIGVADDRSVAAAFSDGEKHAEITVTAALDQGTAPLDIDEKTKSDAHTGLAAKDFKITTETEEPFHGYPALRLAFEGYRKNRFVKGIDLWVRSPKARWLISIEGDGPLFNHLTDDYEKILNEFEFF